ncbi:hypothetical protein LJR220_000729 [Bradyrhizobium sp. LjRoot220]|uniref:hypothetical protein n=1 Tax=Bradyrhizobium sp. LjRoot220 TaxID=3342284 RepID=UPI003ECC51FC
MTQIPALAPANIVTERTEAGEQLLAPFVTPVSVRQRLDHLMAQPLLPRKPQKPLDIGLFDEIARNQLSLF